MPHDRPWLDAKFETAQLDALKRKLPLAAVVCIEPEQYSGKLPYLQAIEKKLGEYGLPLIVLIGSEAKTLPSLVKHSRPTYVYGHGGGGAGGTVKLQNHPYKWPGIVIKTNELKIIVDKKDYMC